MMEDKKSLQRGGPAILEDLFYGNIHPYEKRYDPSSEYAKYVDAVADGQAELNAFLKGLPDAGDKADIFSQLMDAQGEIGCLSELERFTEGFRLGAGLMLETFILPRQGVLRDVEPL